MKYPAHTSAPHTAVRTVDWSEHAGGSSARSLRAQGACTGDTREAQLVQGLSPPARGYRLSASSGHVRCLDGLSCSAKPSGSLSKSAERVITSVSKYTPPSAPDREMGWSGEVGWCGEGVIGQAWWDSGVVGRLDGGAGGQ